MVNQGGDRDRTAKNLVNRNEQENADITLGTDITLQDNQPKICSVGMLTWLYHKIMLDIREITNIKVQLNTQIKLDAKSYTKCITFITYERERQKSPLLNYNKSIQQLITCC